MTKRSPIGPLSDLHDWDHFLQEKVYPQPGARSPGDYRNYNQPACDRIREFYRLHHEHQTYAFVASQTERYLPLRRCRMSVFAALEFLNTLVDDSDPDTDLDQLQHLLQTSEAIRADGHEDWFVLAGLLHDLGKVLCLFGEPQWAVVGDTFPVGCAHCEKIVYHEFFAGNPDSHDSRYNTQLGCYSPNCGLKNLKMSWGHDEYMYHVVKEFLPDTALYMIRYHSFYAWHREGQYDYLCDQHDRQLLPWVQLFNNYDLYSKVPAPADWERLRPYYEELVHRFLPDELSF